MKKEDLTDKEMKYYRRFKLAAQNLNVRDQSDVDAVTEQMGSFVNKLAPYTLLFFGVISAIIAIVQLAFANVPVLSVIIAVIFTTMAVKLLRVYNTIIPKVAQVYADEEFGD